MESPTPQVIHLFGRLTNERRLAEVVTSSLLARGGRSRICLHLSGQSNMSHAERATLRRLVASTERLGLRLRVLNVCPISVMFAVDRLTPDAACPASGREARS
jgi:hypothetical protein